MIFPVGFHHHHFRYLFQRDISKLYTAIGIRNLALGLVAVFEPIFFYLYFDESFPAVLLLYGVMFGLYGLLVGFTGKLLAKVGTAKTILISYFFYIGYYVCLFFLEQHPLLLPLAVAIAVAAMLLFWPAFHIDFTRFSSQEQRGGEVGNMNMAMLLPVIVAPIAGGWIVATFGFLVLFLVVIAVLFASAIPLFHCKEQHEVYTDSFRKAVARIVTKENRRQSIAFASDGLEFMIYAYVWPVFLFSLVIGFGAIGGIVSFALLGATLFMLYVGRVSETQERPWLLNIGSVWTAIAWVINSFVRTPFDALLAQALYRISRAGAAIPFQTFFYEKAASQTSEADEFVIYREILINTFAGLFFMGAAGVYAVFPGLPIQAFFFVAALGALGFMFLGNPPNIRLRRA